MRLRRKLNLVILAALALSSLVAHALFSPSPGAKYRHIERLCTRDSPASTPLDGIDQLRNEYRRVFRLGYFKAWGCHLR